MPTAITSRTGVAKLLQPYLLIADCADQYCFADVFGYRPRAAYRPIRASIDSFGGNSGGNFLAHKTKPATAQSSFREIEYEPRQRRTILKDLCGRDRGSRRRVRSSSRRHA